MYFWIPMVATIVIAYIVGNKKEVKKIWNYILLFFLIIDAWFIGQKLIEVLPKFFNWIIQYLQNMVSSLDAVILVALITSLISLLNSFYSKYSDKKSKRREYLATKREEPYTEFISLVYKLSQNNQNHKYTDEELIKDIQSFNSKITLWGSPKVVDKWIKFRKSSLTVGKETASKENLILIEEVMNEMRKDLGVKSVNKGNLLSIFINDIEKVIKK